MRNVDIDAVLQCLAEHKIEAAMRGGKFDNLKGAGKPLDLESAPVEERARMAWYAMRLMKQNGFTPEEVQWRMRIDELKAELEQATTTPRVEGLVRQINSLVQQL